MPIHSGMEFRIIPYFDYVLYDSVPMADPRAKRGNHRFF